MPVVQAGRLDRLFRSEIHECEVRLGADRDAAERERQSKPIRDVRRQKAREQGPIVAPALQPKVEHQWQEMLRTGNAAPDGKEIVTTFH